MATYIALVDFTADGISHIQETTRRSQEFVTSVEKLGVKSRTSTGRWERTTAS